jgi:hypothetical protein
MVVATLLIAAALIVISVTASLIAISQRKTAAQRFSRRFGLDVPDGFEPTIRAGLEARRIGAPIGVVIGVVIATTLLLANPGLTLLATWWCLFGAYLLGATLGGTTAILLAERRRDASVVRVARTSALTVGDYVPPFQTVFSYICIGLAIVAFAGDVWLSIAVSPYFLSIVSGVVAAIGVVALICYLVISHRLVSRGAIAGTPLELAWDDALRSYALTNLSTVVCLIPLYSLVAYDALLVNPAGIDANPLFSVFTGLLPIAATFGIVAAVVVTTLTRSRQHFLRRLWPELAPKVDPNVSGTYTSVMGGR